MENNDKSAHDTTGSTTTATEAAGGISTSSPSAIPLPPPLPPANQRLRIESNLTNQHTAATNHNASAAANERTQPNGHFTFDGQRVPSALASAFNQPSKDKQPFTYFPGGITPDVLTNEGRCTPSSVRRASAGTPTSASLPRVLPLFPPVTDNDYSMPTVAHLQYNSPMALYSQDSAQEAFRHQTHSGPVQPGFGSSTSEENHRVISTRPAPKRPEWDPAQSATYKALMEAEEDDRHGGRPVTPHSARMEEPVIVKQGETEYPHYHGFQNPHFQSPSFKRLQFLTGGEHQGNYYGGSLKQRTPSPRPQSQPQPQQQQQHVIQKPTAMPAPQPQPQQQAVPVEAPMMPVAARDPSADPDATDPNKPIDPMLAAKLAEAERPKVQPQQQPHWAAKAAQKHQKWAGAGGEHVYDPMAGRQHEHHDPEPHWTQHSLRRQDKWQRHYGGLEHGTSAAERPPSRGRAYTPTPRQPGYEMGGQVFGDASISPTRRAKSQEPGWRGTPSSHRRPKTPSYVPLHNEKEWMKPYVAPNVLAYGKHSGNGVGSVVSNQHLVQATVTSPGAHQISSQKKAKPVLCITEQRHYQPPPSGPTGFGVYYGPTDGFKHGRRSRSSHRHDHLGHGGLEFGTDYSRFASGIDYRKLAAKYHVQETVAPHVDTTEQRQALVDNFEHENEAWRRKQEMEQQIAQRRLQQSTATVASISPRAHVSPRPAGPPESHQGTDFTGYRASNVMSSSVGSQQIAHYTPATTGWRSSAAATTGMGDLQITDWHTTQGPNWYARAGASTKASTSGDYVDQEGNKVHYKKEMYTSADPGKEYSMLTEEEKKVMEEPLQPGVISRHVTTKYYKKSTFANQSTTSSAQPIGSVSPRLAIEGPIKTGEITPGVSQF